jgi:transposase
MPTERISMRKLKEIMRLKFEARLTNRQIGCSINISPATVSRYLSSIKDKGVTWELAKDIGEEELEARIYSKSKDPTPLQHLTPDCAYLNNELKKKNVTKQLLWEEYCEQHPNNYYSYSQFCAIYRNWCAENNLSMRQTHIAGEKLFVDYCGHTIPIKCKYTGNITEAQIFTAVLGASNYTYAEATMTQSLPDWIMSHVRAFNFFDGVAQIVIPDNLRSGISKSCKYEPDINPTYHQMAQHYNIAVIPARVRKAKDKAKVEVGVQVVQRWILARLRNNEFYSLSELNNYIKNLLEDLNNRPFKKLPGCRRSAYLELDKPALHPLPKEPYQFVEIIKAKVHVDYHIEIDRRYYSVPYTFVKKTVEAHITANTVSIYYKGDRIASHPKIHRQGQHATIFEHMPVKHQKYHDWNPGRFLNWAQEIGTSTCEVIKSILEGRTHPQQAYRSCLGVLALARRYSKPRLEAACARAIHIGAKNRKSVLSILQNGLDQVPLETATSTPIKNHENIRGSQYYT